MITLAVTAGFKLHVQISYIFGRIDADSAAGTVAGNPNPTSNANPFQGSLTQVGTIPAGVTVLQVS